MKTRHKNADALARELVREWGVPSVLASLRRAAEHYVAHPEDLTVDKPRSLGLGPVLLAERRTRYSRLVEILADAEGKAGAASLLIVNRNP